MRSMGKRRNIWYINFWIFCLSSWSQRPIHQSKDYQTGLKSLRWQHVDICRFWIGKQKWMRSSPPATWPHFTLTTTPNVSLHCVHPLHHLSLPTANIQFVLQPTGITNHLPSACVYLDPPQFFHIRTSVAVCLTTALRHQTLYGL